MSRYAVYIPLIHKHSLREHINSLSHEEYIEKREDIALPPSPKICLGDGYNIEHARLAYYDIYIIEIV